MKKLLRLSSMLVTAVLLAFSAQEARASHYQGGDMTYACIAPNTFVVTMKLYRDCTGATAPSTASLNVKSPGCNTGRNVTMTKIGGNRIGDPYCPSIPKVCGSATVNYEEVTFKATVTFSAAEATCADWLFNWSECCRPNTANLVGQGTFYIEAGVKLFTPAVIAGTTNPVVHNNSSPEFSALNVPVPFICVGQQIQYSINANEFDGDSLSYELAPALSNTNTPEAYKPIGNQGGGIITNPNPLPPYTTTAPNIQYATFPPGMGNYSPTYPISSFTVNWNQINPATGIPYPVVQATPFFQLDPLSGQLIFRPGEYVQSTPVQGLNKYAVVVLIKEWRRMPNGVMVNVGFVRRDILFIVEDCSGNQVPTSNPVQPPAIVGATVRDSVFIVQTCTTTRIKLNYVDQNATDNITVTFAPNAAAGIPNGNLQVFNNGTPQVRAFLDITPLPGDAGNNYFIPVRIEDDACPIKGIANYVYRIQVVATNRVNILDDKVKTICLGQSLPITSQLQRPDSLLGDEAVYTYEWSGDNGLNPAEKNNKNITVTPTVVTGPNDSLRYIVKVKSNLNGCEDTDTIWVKVNPNPTIKDITVAYPQGKNEIVFGRSAQLTTILDNPATGLKYSWSPGAGLSDSTIANPIASPLKTTEYTLTVTSADGVCEGTRVVTVNVGPFFLPNVITPNNDGMNDFFEYKGIQPGTSLKIYSRWGVLIKEYSSYDNSFNGEGVSDGTYYYMIQEPNGGKSYKGWFEIVRN